MLACRDANFPSGADCIQFRAKEADDTDWTESSWIANTQFHTVYANLTQGGDYTCSARWGVGYGLTPAAASVWSAVKEFTK